MNYEKNIKCGIKMGREISKSKAKGKVPKKYDK